jgi:hypothetical protein
MNAVELTVLLLVIAALWFLSLLLRAFTAIPMYVLFPGLLILVALCDYLLMSRYLKRMERKPGHKK